MTTPLRTETTVPLRVAGSVSTAQVGAKAHTLGRLMNAGFEVPDGVVLTAQVWDDARRATGLGAEPTVEQVLAIDMPTDVRTLLDETLAGLGGDRTFAVRSSAVDEDGADASFAGQFETVLHVRGNAALHDAVLRCWASAYSYRVQRYRRSHGVAGSAIAVLIQHQVDADVAGVAFTADAVTGSLDHVSVSAIQGLGDVVVGGEVVPDEWHVCAGKAVPVRATHQALTESQARAVADLALRVQQELGGPQDVEWAMAGGRLVVLQARPITALPQRPEFVVPPGTWIKESDRHPEPLTAFGASLVAPIVSRGLSGMFARYGGLLERMETLSVGGEPYVHPVPPGGHEGTPPPWWMLAVLCRVSPHLRTRMRAAKHTMRPGVLEDIAEEWRTHWQPEFQRTARRLRDVDLVGLGDEQLVRHFDDVRAEMGRAMDVHFAMIPPYLVPVHQLVETCSRLFGWSDARALGLLAGTSDATSASTRALAALAADIRQNPEALAAVERTGDGMGERLAAAASALADAYDQWCEKYAYRNVNDDPGSPLLAEMPWLLERLLREATLAPNETLGRTTAESVLAEARSQLSTSTAADRDAFETTLASARRAYPLREDVAFWTGSVFGGCLRMVALEIGRRLVSRGCLERPDDVVHLTADSVQTALAHTNPQQIRRQVRQARAERAWTRQHPGPPFHGPPPAALPDLRGLPREARRLNAAFLWMQRPDLGRDRPTSADELISGTPAAPGTYSGPVRVISGVADFARLRPGDVLVCSTTDPAWTVLFGTASALVTDNGGVLSHAAIVARESAIPAVVGTTDATTVLTDGQIVTVDGGAGTVTGSVRSRQTPPRQTPPRQTPATRRKEGDLS